MWARTLPREKSLRCNRKLGPNTKDNFSFNPISSCWGHYLLVILYRMTTEMYTLVGRYWYDTYIEKYRGMYSGPGQFNSTGTSTHKPVPVAGKSDFSTLKPHVWKKAYRSALRTIDFSLKIFFEDFINFWTSAAPQRPDCGTVPSQELTEFTVGGVGATSEPARLLLTYRYGVVVSVNISFIEENGKKIDQSVALLQNRTIHRKKPISLEHSYRTGLEEHR